MTHVGIFVMIFIDKINCSTQKHTLSWTVFFFKSLYITATFCLCRLIVSQINLGLLILSLAGFLLPGYLYYHRRHLLREKQARDKRAVGQEMLALNHTEANGYKPHSNGLAAVEA